MNVRGQGAHADIASLLLRAMIGHLQAPSRKYVRRCISARRFGKGLEWVGAATDQRKARGGESAEARRGPSNGSADFDHKLLRWRQLNVFLLTREFSGHVFKPSRLPSRGGGTRGTSRA